MCTINSCCNPQNLEKLALVMAFMIYCSGMLPKTCVLSFVLHILSMNSGLRQIFFCLKQSLATATANNSKYLQFYLDASFFSSLDLALIYMAG